MAVGLAYFFIIFGNALIIQICFGEGHEIPTHSMYAKQCTVWQNISESMQREPNLEMKCMRNRECSGFDCIGKYNYKGMLAPFLQLQKDFCTGLVVEACNTPPNIHMYIVVFSSNGNSTEETDFVISGDNMVPVKGTQFKVLGSTTRGFIDIKMNHTDINGQPHIFLSAFLREKIYSRMFGEEISYFLSGFDVGIIRGMYIPVPHCDPRIDNHTHSPGMCNWNDVSHLERQGSMSKCNPDSMDSCGNFEMCEDSHCVCLPNYIYNNKTEACIHEDIITFIDPASDTKHSTGQKNILIIACSIGGILILVAIIVLTMIRHRRHRARYAQHGLLTQEDDDMEIA